MKKFLPVVCCVFAATASPAFEGSITISFAQGDYRHEMLLRVKDNKVWMQSKSGGNKKYSGYLCDLKTGDFFAVSAPGKKAILHFHLDSLTAYYEQQDLKPGYRRQCSIAWKETDKVKAIGGINATRFVAEGAEAWAAESRTPLPRLIPLLRLLDVWNECQMEGKDILESTTGNTKHKATVLAAIQSAKTDDAFFQLPADYRAVDFSKMMSEKRNDPQLKLLIQTFAEF